MTWETERDAAAEEYDCNDCSAPGVKGFRAFKSGADFGRQYWEARVRELEEALKKLSLEVSCINKCAAVVDVPSFKSGIGLAIPTNVFELLIEGYQEAEKILALRAEVPPSAGER